MHIKGKGQLRHRFWGKYSAAIILVFDDVLSSADALKALGKPWKQLECDSKAVYCVCSREELEWITAQLVGFGAEEKKIASVAKSIDFGEPFEVTIPVVPSEQTSVF